MGGQQAVENEVPFPSNGTLMNTNESHFNIWLASGRVALSMQHKTRCTASLHAFTNPVERVKD